MLTTNDIMEELSLAYVRAVASREGFAVEETRRDRDSIDLEIRARGDLGGSLVSPILGVQLKSTRRDLPNASSDFHFDLKVKNYNDLVGSTFLPTILVVLFLPEDEAEWLTWTEDALLLRRCAYWSSLRGLPPTDNESTYRVHIPRRQTFDGPTLRALLTRVARQEPILP